MLSYREAPSTRRVTTLRGTRWRAMGAIPDHVQVPDAAGCSSGLLCENRSMPLITSEAMSIPADLPMRYAMHTFEKQYI
ncbi:hypothetical protein KDH_10920 [Dictyobacter sp. S3.2.2.5]|uniref:Uncharacterized protein n=1 Tax=Dictyobacter halimunensis TaxID=3026934 RepID=A0ABQ6FKX0_9CHLR|nr:hypothetical protein KDH_10920 [Dictyobacter sp. S3.2.2.5]